MFNERRRTSIGVFAPCTIEFQQLVVRRYPNLYLANQLAECCPAEQLNPLERSGNPMPEPRPDLVTVFKKFIEAWNVHDPADLRRLLEETCDSKIEISSPFGEYRGIDQQFEEISRFRAQFPNGRCTTRILSQHHSMLLQAWTTEFGGVRSPLTGIDCVQFNEAGRIVRTISFSPVAAPP